MTPRVVKNTEESTALGLACLYGGAGPIDSYWCKTQYLRLISAVLVTRLIGVISVWSGNGSKLVSRIFSLPMSGRTSVSPLRLTAVGAAMLIALAKVKGLMEGIVTQVANLCTMILKFL